MSPWVTGYADVQVASMNALVLGIILVLEELLELGVHESAEEWIDMVAGIWLIASPFALGFTDSMPALLNAEIVGLLTVLFAALAMSTWDDKIGSWWHDHVTGH
jgi:hypothetical protein